VPKSGGHQRIDEIGTKAMNFRTNPVKILRVMAKIASKFTCAKNKGCNLIKA
jgi:hypothetical protein